MTFRPALRLLFIIILSIAAGGHPAAFVPPAPGPLSPANGANVQVPFTISWSPVSDPAGIVAYNWQVSSSSSFSPVILQNSTSGSTQDTVSGLANGTYFWRVQAVNGAFEQGAFSAARSVTVTGPGPGSPGTPTLDPTVAYSTFHPFEVIRFNWSAASGAATYVLEAATDPSFPVATRILFDNIPTTTFSFAIGNPEGSYFARVRAVSASGIVGVPSNVITFSVFYNNPIGPPPAPVSPLNNPTLTLPVTLTWTDVPNPQPSGYEVQIAKNSSFTTIEEDDPQLNGPSRTVLSLTPGPKFWRVRSAQGDASPTTAALTAFSAAGSFTISTAPATPVSVVLTKDPLFSAETTLLQLQLTAAVPAGGATITLTSSNPSALPVPATVTMQGNIAWLQFQVQAGQVVSPTPVTITATLNGGSASGQFTVMPPSLKSLSLNPSTISGGTSAGAIVMLNGAAPSIGAVVSLSSNSAAVTPPSTVTVTPGSFSASFSIPTSNVTSSTPATITASWNGTTVQSNITVVSGPVPTSLTLFPSTVVGGGPGSVDGTVTIAAAAAFDQFLGVSSNNQTVLPFLSNSVLVPAFSTRGLIQILPGSVPVQTLVTISVSGGGVTKSAVLTVNPSGTPPPPATLSNFTVSPTSVAGGTPATGTVTLPSAAPSGGTVVALTSNLPGAATVPATVTVPAGSTSTTFTVTTFPSAGTTVQLSARLVDSILFAALGVTAPAPPPTPVAPSLLSPASGATPAQPIAFDWNDVANAASYIIQIDDSSSFTTPLVREQTVTSSQYTTTGLAAVRHFWRVRGVNATGTAGAWSSSRSFTPAGAPATAALASVSTNPAIVVGGTGSTGTATLTAAAPSGGALVSLSSNNTAATVPLSVTLAAGATNATFAVTTSSVVANTPVTISAAYNGVTKTTVLTVNPPSQTTTATLTVSATGRSGERVTSSPAGINVTVGSTGSASFTTGTSITLTVSNGRDAVWSGACSSGGNKAKSCTFTLNGNATVTGNVQ